MILMMMFELDMGGWVPAVLSLANRFFSYNGAP